MEKDREKKIMIIVGTRPNYMKAFPIYEELQKLEKYNLLLVHTGQHYDKNMFEVFFNDFDMPKPDIIMNLKGKNQSQQLGEIVEKLSIIMNEEKPDLTIVLGDVTSTLAGALASNKQNILLAHVEAGLRSGDRTMPEEINRILTDQISDYLFVTEQSGSDNILKSDITDKQKNHTYFVGNSMIDTLIKMLSKIRENDFYKSLLLSLENYIVVTLHRPSNVDDPKKLSEIVKKLKEINKLYKIVWPIHPRTKLSIDTNKIDISEFTILNPLGYVDFMNLVYYSKLVITDSGGIQEETTYLSKPCLTLRENTERPSTLVENEGTNVLTNIENLLIDIKYTTSEKFTISKKKVMYDGNASLRTATILDNILSNE